MSEEKMDPIGAQADLVRRLQAIGVDLWGKDGKTGAAELPEENTAADAGKAPEPGGDTAARRVGADNLWKTADETVDWTDALLCETPRDGLTDAREWRFYHRVAEKVLAGDTAAYAEVLTTVNPLGDLIPFVSGITLRASDADRLECEFECSREEYEKSGRDYLGALSLRIVRDLFAVLPVSEVWVKGNLDGEKKADVRVRREQLLKQKVAFLNPADFLETCGGTFL